MINLKIGAHILVSGKVQGVFFRASTAQKARQQGLTGWVMNLPDGRVEAVVEGEKERVDQMVVFCKQGPRDAKVETFALVWQPYTGRFSGFEEK